MAKIGSGLSLVTDLGAWVMVASVAVASVVGASTGGAAAAGCQKGIASAPYVGAADMRAIDRAAVHLPAVRPHKVHVSIGAPVPSGIARKPLPAAVAKVLPQYSAAGYSAFRAGQQLAVVNTRGVLVYVMPIGAPTKPGNCP